MSGRGVEALFASTAPVSTKYAERVAELLVTEHRQHPETGRRCVWSVGRVVETDGGQYPVRYEPAPAHACKRCGGFVLPGDGERGPAGSSIHDRCVKHYRAGKARLEAAGAARDQAEHLDVARAFREGELSVAMSVGNVEHVERLVAV